MLKALIVLSVILTANGIVVNQYNKDNITTFDGNCFGELSYFLCNCFNNTDHVDLQLMDGVYNLRQLYQPSLSHCLLSNKTKVNISGLGTNVSIYCENFNIAILNSSNINIQNLKLMNCGHFVDGHINASYNVYTPSSYFGQNFRFFAMVYNSINATFYNVSMLYTLGYSMVFINVLETVELIRVTIQNTTFENDPRCDGYNYNDNNDVDFLCSGAGVLFLYPSNETLDATGSIVSANINHCLFEGNKNIIPAKEFNNYRDLISSGFFRDSLPIIGAGCVTIYYGQSSYNVTTNVLNSLFYNNNGTLTATVGIATFAGIYSKTNFDSCVFEDNGRVENVLNDASFRRSGIIFYYIRPLFIPGLSMTGSILQAEMLTIFNSNFTMLGSNINGRFGGAIQIEKNSPDSVSVVVTIRQCNFVGNEAIAGSAIYAKDTAFYLSSDNTASIGRLSVNLENVNLHHNTLPPNGNIYHATGVIYFVNCQINLECYEQCNFMNNQPSVIHGQNSAITVAGNLSLQYNKAASGGAMTLINTVLYIKAGSSLLFSHNYAIISGGAITIRFFNTGIKVQDIFPIQFVGAGLIRNYNALSSLNVNITFEENYVADNASLESINSNVFYLCMWYPGTSVGILSDENVPVVNSTRVSVYRQILNFVPYHKVSEHLNIIAYTPCFCDNNGSFSDYVTLCLTGGTVNLSEPVIPGWTFSLNLTALTVVGDVGYSDSLSSFIAEGESLVLEDDQRQRSFSVNRTKCTVVDFTVFIKVNSSIPNTGLITLAVGFVQIFSVSFELVDCPFGYEMQETSINKYGCVCDKFFFTENVRDDFQCAPGKIVRNDLQSWLSVVNNRLEYSEFCLPTYCNSKVKNFNLSSYNVLCANNHAGRACGGCLDGYSRVFGSSSCKQCSNAWLATILLYGLLGIFLVILIHKLQLTVTVGAINGLVFFCNCMSINGELLLNTKISTFWVLRVFISLVNLDLGFSLCFYHGMSQLAKTGLQFVFPVYLWLVIATIIFLGRYYVHSKHSFSHSAASVLATLILLSYLKIMRTIIEIYSLSQVDISNHAISVWRPDPNIEYCTGFHILLFIISSLFLVGFITPFAVGFTFPKIVLRSKRLSRLFPLIDSFVAAYKDKYRYWFGIRTFVLVLLSAISFVAFESPETVLAVSIVIIGMFTLVQAYICPYKSRLINTLDLIFMEIFLLLGVLSLFFSFINSTSNYDNVDITVTVFGYCSFLLFLLLIVYHIYNISKEKKWFTPIAGIFSKKHEEVTLQSANSTAMKSFTRDHITAYDGDDSNSRYDYYRESLLEHI